MPLIGIIDPAHNSRKKLKLGEYPKWYTLDELDLESQTSNPKWSPWTHELVAAALGEHQERGDRISVTALTTGCPRGLVMERKEDYIAAIDGMYPPLRGTLLHAALERYGRTGSIVEARFYVTIDGIELSGSPDLLTIDTIYDYKMTENPPNFGYPYRHHTEQLMFGAFIARNAEKWDYPTELPFDPREHPVTNALVVYLGPKGPKPILVEKKQEFTTPSGAVREGKRPYIWSDGETLDEIRPRLHMLKRALEVYPEWPEGAEELWGGDPGWGCPGPPFCYLPDCLAKRKILTWKKVD